MYLKKRCERCKYCDWQGFGNMFCEYENFHILVENKFFPTKDYFWCLSGKYKNRE